MAITRLKPSTNINLAARVYASVKQAIFDFHLMPGDRFTEGVVAARMRVSRTPVREALYHLEREGYLEVLFRSGWRVKLFDFAQFENLYDLRVILETAAVPMPRVMKHGKMSSITSRCSTTRSAVTAMPTAFLQYSSNSSISSGSKVSTKSGAIHFEADHASSPVLKIAATFFDSTKSAAVSASARSLRCNSRSDFGMKAFIPAVADDVRLTIQVEAFKDEESAAPKIAGHCGSRHAQCRLPMRSSLFPPEKSEMRGC